jgi:hypothetical protein
MGRSLKMPLIDRFFNGSVAHVDRHDQDSGVPHRR